MQTFQNHPSTTRRLVSEAQGSFRQVIILTPTIDGRVVQNQRRVLPHQPRSIREVASEVTHWLFRDK